MTTQPVNAIELDNFIALCNSRLDTVLQSYMQDIPSLELKNATEYTLLNSGKRLRPLLAYAAGMTFNAPMDALDIPAAAIEMVHTYSLIHDDLPCMDNADLRRGKPTCHKEFSEAMAVLTGDGLLTLAMQILSSRRGPVAAEKRIAMLDLITRAAGPYGMVAGQAYDITVSGNPSVSSELLLDIYRLKTGVLFTSCLELGRLASKDEDEVNKRALYDFGTHIGLAFQIQDDILDMTGKDIGKSQGIDAINKTITYPKLHGLDKARDKVQTLYLQALEAIDYLGERAQLLRELAQQMLSRQK